MEGLSNTTSELKSLLLNTLALKRQGTEEQQTEALMDLRATVIEVRSIYTDILKSHKEKDEAMKK